MQTCIFSVTICNDLNQAYLYPAFDFFFIAPGFKIYTDMILSCD